MDLFDGILYINLKHRKDRLKHIERELFDSEASKLLKIPREKVIRIEGIYNPQKGHLGCTESHIVAQQYAIDRNWSRVLVLEDDFEWIGPKYPRNKLKVFQRLVTGDNPIPWDILFFSANVLRACPEPRAPQTLRRVVNGQAGAGYAVNGLEYLKKLQGVFKESVAKMRAGDPIHRSAPDILWKKLQSTDKWYSFAPTNLGRQYSSYSDNRKRKVAYKHT